RVLGRRRLQLEIERAAEALAQRKSEGAVDARAERRMDDQLHATRFVEEALEHQGVGGGQPAEHTLGGRRLLDELLRRAPLEVEELHRTVDRVRHRVCAYVGYELFDCLSHPRYRR